MSEQTRPVSEDVRATAAKERALMLREGEPLEVIRQLSAFNGELRLALQNALERIARLEREHVELKREFRRHGHG